MFSVPPNPGWDGLHPLIIHFPIALLLTAPLFVLVGAVFAKRGRWASWAGLVLLVMGTVAAFVSKETGEAAAQLVEVTGTVEQTLERHEDLAELTIKLFAAVTAAFVVLLAAQWKWPKLARAAVHIPAHLTVLALLLGAGVLLANTGHQGGRLVHEMGVRAMVGGAAPVASTEDGR